MRSIHGLLLAALAAAAQVQAADVDLARPVPVVERKSPLVIGSGAADQVVEFTAWKSAIRPNDVVGKLDSGMFCAGNRPLLYSKRLHDWFSDSLAKAYRDEASRAGISAAEASRSAFDDAGSGKGAAYKLGATLLEWDHRVCVGGGEVKGSVYAKLKWELFSNRRQKVVYTTVVEASHASDAKVQEKKFDAEFFRALVQNLLADPKLAEAIKSGGVVDGVDAAASAPVLQLSAGSTTSGGVAKGIDKLQAAVATIESGTASGSGFYISRDGYLLTNAHVVRGNTFVRVRLADGRNLVGEVVRSDTPRDVALVRTDPVAIDVLPLRHEEARVGEDVYALGSPYGKILSGTLTRGVLSARRVIEGVAFLQSDVAVNPGNSGGPLIDADGRVLGIAQLHGPGTGLNLFIPIDEAVDRLSVAVSMPQATAAK